MALFTDVVTPPVVTRVVPGWVMGFKGKTIVLSGIRGGGPEVSGVVLSRTGKVVCTIHSTKNEDGCVVTDICGDVSARCPQSPATFPPPFNDPFIDAPPLEQFFPTK